MNNFRELNQQEMTNTEGGCLKHVLIDLFNTLFGPLLSILGL